MGLESAKWPGGLSAGMHGIQGIEENLALPEAPCGVAADIVANVIYALRSGPAKAGRRVGANVRGVTLASGTRLLAEAMAVFLKALNPAWKALSLPTSSSRLFTTTGLVPVER